MFDFNSHNSITIRLNSCCTISKKVILGDILQNDIKLINSVPN